ncbi:MAG: deoxyribodipyrimidine photo-lyase, partial [Bdellovibrionales bacterium]|nr:deoxyribodipyrimidine photo-lyase [Bdellovibrionales bacterium]
MGNVHNLSLVWLRRDLRLDDNVALSRATQESRHVALVFVFDTKILNALKSKSDMRVTFIHDTLVELDQELRQRGSRLIVLYGDPSVEVPKLVQDLNAQALYFNEDYEPYAKLRDAKVKKAVEALGVKATATKDHVVFSGSEVNKADGSPYKMFTPYKNAWLKKLRPNDYAKHEVKKNIFCPDKYLRKFAKLPTLDEMGFKPSRLLSGSVQAGRKSALTQLEDWTFNLKNYGRTRDFPSLVNGTSGLSVHLRFGTISIRECVRACAIKPNEGARVWLSELIWRDFYQMILDRFPHVAKSAFKPEYDKIKWRGSNAHFKAWCEGRTGFPIVDAGMRQLNETGWMHNRVRMITASFLVKDLLVDWKLGEKYFAEKLLDFELASNNGGWQWCASTGCDAQPYFRIF